MKMKDVMSVNIQTIGIDQPIEVAKLMMYQNSIRHLPVLNGGKFEGILSDRDIKLAYAVDGVKAQTLKVGDVCNGEVYTVTPETPVKEVAAYMGKTGIGSAIIIDHDQLVGIFTTTDACRLLGTL